MRRLALVAVSLVAVLALAGCSDDTEEPDPTTTTAAPESAADFSFRPVLVVRDAADCNAGDADHLRDAANESCYELGPPPVDPVTFVSARAVIDFEDEWVVAPVLTDDDSGIGALNALAEPCFARAADCPTGQVAMVLDGEVLSAPTIQAESFAADQIMISGDYDQQEAEDLAERLAP
jgi:preprotein translocase subunit SecD